MFKVNGYTIEYNDFWGMWQASHPEIGPAVAESKYVLDVIEHAEKG